DLRVQQLALDVETKTKDNVFVKMPVSVQYHVIPDKVYEAFYKLANPRQQMAATARGEAEKILKVKQAEAEAESKALQGQGIANQRKAIIEGLKDSVEAFSKAVEGSTPKDVMMLVLVTQYLDTMKEIGSNDKSNTILMSHSPAAVGDLFRQMQDAIMIGQKGASVSQ